MHRVELSFIGDKLQFEGVADTITAVPRTVGTLFVLDGLAEGIDLIVLHGIRPELTDQTVAAFLTPLDDMISRQEGLTLVDGVTVVNDPFDVEMQLQDAVATMERAAVLGEGLKVRRGDTLFGPEGVTQHGIGSRP